MEKRSSNIFSKISSVTTKRSPVKNIDHSTIILPENISLIAVNSEKPIYTNFSRRPELYNKEEVNKWMTVPGVDCNIDQHKGKDKKTWNKISKKIFSVQSPKKSDKHSFPATTKENQRFFS